MLVRTIGVNACCSVLLDCPGECWSVGAAQSSARKWICCGESVPVSHTGGGVGSIKAKTTWEKHTEEIIIIISSRGSSRAHPWRNMSPPAPTYLPNSYVLYSILFYIILAGRTNASTSFFAGGFISARALEEKTQHMTKVTIPQTISEGKK